MRDVRDSEKLGVSSSRKPSLTASGTLTLTLFTLSCSCLVTVLSAPLPSEGRASHHCVPSTAQHMPGYTAGPQKMPWSSPGRLAFSTSLLPLCLCLFLTQPSLFHPILKGSSGEDAHPLILKGPSGEDYQLQPPLMGCRPKVKALRSDQTPLELALGWASVREAPRRLSFPDLSVPAWRMEGGLGSLWKQPRHKVVSPSS